MFACGLRVPPFLLSPLHFSSLFPPSPSLPCSPSVFSLLVPMFSGVRYAGCRFAICARQIFPSPFESDRGSRLAEPQERRRRSRGPFAMWRDPTLKGAGLGFLCRLVRCPGSVSVLHRTMLSGMSDMGSHCSQVQCRADLCECLSAVDDIVGLFNTGGSWDRRTAVDLRFRPSATALRMSQLVRHHLRTLTCADDCTVKIWQSLSQAEMSCKRKRQG